MIYRKDLDKYEVRSFIRGKTSKSFHIKMYYDKARTKPYIEFTVIDGHNHGLMTSWHPNGVLQSKEKWVDGNINGYFNYYDDKGVKAKTVFYHGYYEDKTVFHIKDGLIIKRNDYTDDQLTHDYRFIYYPNKALHKFICMKGGKNLFHISINEDTFHVTNEMIILDNVRDKMHSSDVSCVTTSYAPDNKTITRICTTKHGVPDGYQCDYRDNGQKAVEYTLVNKKYHGDCTWYHENGKPKNITRFDHGNVLDMMTFDEDGRVTIAQVNKSRTKCIGKTQIMHKRKGKK